MGGDGTPVEVPGTSTALSEPEKKHLPVKSFSLPVIAKSTSPRGSVMDPRGPVDLAVFGELSVEVAATAP